MQTTSVRNLCRNTGVLLKNVYNDKSPLIITRPRSEDLVVITLEEYNAINETSYLLRSKANAEHLKKSIEQGERGETIKVDIENLWI